MQSNTYFDTNAKHNEHMGSILLQPTNTPTQDDTILIHLLEENEVNEELLCHALGCA